MTPPSFFRRWTSVLLLSVPLLVTRGPGQHPAPSLRLTEPRLTGFDGWRPCTMSLPPDHVVEIADCGPANLPRDLVSLAASECEDKMRTATDAVRLLAFLPQCTDAAVEKLEELPGTDARHISDLAAAYYVRAQRKDQPSDFVRSLDAADRAAALAPSSSAIRFNQALAQEALDFSADAIRSWDALRKGAPSGWAKEAAGHYDRLVSKRNRQTAFRWELNQERIPIAVAAGDRKAIEQLVTPFCSAASRWVEEQVLPKWAAASAENRGADAAHQLEIAEMVASALSRVTRDRYLLDSLNCIRSCTSVRQRRSLEHGHRAFGIARGGTRRLTPSAPMYSEAERALSAAGSPLRFEATLGMVTALTQASRYEEAHRLLGEVEKEGERLHYPSLLARVHSGRGYLLLSQNRDIDALAEYSQAQSIFQRHHDLENAGNTQNYIVGLLRRIGNRDLTWHAVARSQQYVPHLVEAQSRHVNLGENALAAVALGYPSVALHYQNLAIRMLQDELSHSTGDDNAITQLRRNLGIALRTRAGIDLLLNDRARAENDLAASTPLMGTGQPNDASIPLGFRARLAEAEAQTVGKTDPRRAIGLLSEAIDLASKTLYRTLMASLRLQRADLYRLVGDRAAEAEDLRIAIAALRADERATLEKPSKKRPDIDERLWSTYFGRSQRAYRELIRHYVEDGDDARAFDYAEKSRAYEPLHLVLQRKDLPLRFRALIHNNEPLGLSEVQKLLPAGTFLLEYSVDDDKSYVWVIGRGVSRRLTLPVGESTIKEWTRQLQKYAALGDDADFRRVLAAPFRPLFRDALRIVDQLKEPGETASIVIIPDRSMHGLPFAAIRHGNRYLFQDHAISVDASATLYAYSLAQDRHLADGQAQSVLLFADPTLNHELARAYTLKPLKASRDEAERIRGVYAEVASVAPPLLGDEATVPAFLRLAPKNTIIHIAAHGIANPDVPSRSFLLLAPTGNDPGVLDAERLLKELGLSETRLVVLSACTSAGGTPVGPEGLAPLVRPLIAAGVPAVVGTLWEVSDSAATEDLMVRFHQHYRDGADAANALRLAQQDMLESSFRELRAVWVWSAFQVNGYASSPFPASSDDKRRSQ